MFSQHLWHFHVLLESISTTSSFYHPPSYFSLRTIHVYHPSILSIHPPFHPPTHISTNPPTNPSIHPSIVVGILRLEAQTKESARRDKRPSPGYCMAICFYCVR